MRTGLRTVRRQEEVAAYLLLAPYLLMFVLFMVYPSLHGLYLSFTDARLGRLTASWVGLENFEYVLTDPLFHTVALNTLVFVLESTPLLIVLPLAAAAFSALPLIVVFFVAQRQIIEGIAMTGLKE